ncbi:MAG: hypothetical protein ABSG95_04105 [Solirubrobacteraceae bacterium]|jgi:hypothetical protein
MVPDVGISSIAGRSSLACASIALALAVLFAGCGSSAKTSSRTQATGASSLASSGTRGSCAATVLETLGHVAVNVYNEGVSSERTKSALHMVMASAPLRRALERDDGAAAGAAAQALIATGHMTNLWVIRGNQTLVDLGGPALTPIEGTLKGAGGAPIGTFFTSVWSDSGFTDETRGVAEGKVALVANGREIAGFPLPKTGLQPQGKLTEGGVEYQYTSFSAETYPSGPARVYLLRPIESTTALCGHTSQDTLVNTLHHIATLIYEGETGKRALLQVKRVQNDQSLLRAVALRDPAATTLAVTKLLNQHIVRLRVSAAGLLLADVGGPFVLAPVRGALRLGGRTIGRFVLSIQDDEGYRRLTERLADIRVLMYMGSLLVKNSLGPAPGAVPARGSYQYHGRSFRTFTLHLQAFPSGPLRVTELVPIPYS